MSDKDEAVKDEVVADTTTEESAPTETTTDEAEDSFTRGLNDDDDSAEPMDDIGDAPDTEGDSEESEEAEETEETESKDEESELSETQDDDGEKPLAPKSQERFQKLANENREMRERLAAIESQKTQVATEQELLGQVNPETGNYYTVAEAERIARTKANEQTQANLEKQGYEVQIQQNQQTLANEANQALTEFPELDRQSDKYDEDTAREYDAALSQSLILDKQGNPIGSYLSPYQLAKSIAGPARRAAEKAKTLGQAEAQKATQKMLANADTPSRTSGAVDKPKEDPFLAGFNTED